MFENEFLSKNVILDSFQTKKKKKEKENDLSFGFEVFPNTQKKRKKKGHELFFFCMVYLLIFFFFCKGGLTFYIRPYNKNEEEIFFCIFVVGNL